jgi:TrmH family RNA methyltransferase
VIADRPASPRNLGTLIRSVDAFGGAGVVIVGHAADPYDPQAVRAAQGLLFAVPVVEIATAAAIDGLERRVLGLDERASVKLRDVDRTGRVAIALGTEGRGLSSALRDACDELVSIPMHASAATSLNLAVAGSIALYELTR